MNKFSFGDNVSFKENDSDGHFGRWGVVVLVMPHVTGDNEPQYVIALENSNAVETVHKSESQLILIV